MICYRSQPMFKGAEVSVAFAGLGLVHVTERYLAADQQSHQK